MSSFKSTSSKQLNSDHGRNSSLEMSSVHMLEEIPKLVDAHYAGGEDSQLCTLLLTEGQTAKGFAMAGLSSSLDKKWFGIYPIQGKLQNVRGSAYKSILKNKEVNNIQMILGLQKYRTTGEETSLRYSRVIIMTDADEDGAHIKGLLISFFHFFCPVMLRRGEFLSEFITPYVKATCENGDVKLLYSKYHYEDWKKSLGNNISNWSFKCYKGLGAIATEDAMKYFDEFEDNLRMFDGMTNHEEDLIELAFGKDAKKRKKWIKKFEPGTFRDHDIEKVSYTFSAFIETDLLSFFLLSIKRTVPSLFDGLKTTQRKILFAAFEKPLIQSQPVYVFSGYASEHTNYLHDSHSLMKTVIGMGQGYIRNNIPLLELIGHDNTQERKGEARYLPVKLSPVARTIFPVAYDEFLSYADDYGLEVEPVWYMPIIPMVLVNGCKGITSGCYTFIPRYNPRAIIQNLRWLLSENVEQEREPLEPSYHGYKGNIIHVNENSYVSRGEIRKWHDRLCISGLPLKKTLSSMRKKLYALKRSDYIKGFVDESVGECIDITVELTDKLKGLDHEQLLKKFDLISEFKTNKFYLFHRNGELRKYSSPQEVLDDFYHGRLDFLQTMRERQLVKLKKELKELKDRIECFQLVVSGRFSVIEQQSRDAMLKNLTELLQKPESHQVENTGDISGKQKSYDYLLSMPLKLEDLTVAKLKELPEEKAQLQKRIDALTAESVKTKWLQELSALEEKLKELRLLY